MNTSIRQQAIALAVVEIDDAVSNAYLRVEVIDRKLSTENAIQARRI